MQWWKWPLHLLGPTQLSDESKAEHVPTQGVTVSPSFCPPTSSLTCVRYKLPVALSGSLYLLV